MATETVTEQIFEREADRALTAILASIQDLDGIEADLQLGVLTIEFADGIKYVVNSHRAARQVWMAAERTAWHFDYQPDEQRWIAKKSGDELVSALATVLGKKLGRAIAL